MKERQWNLWGILSGILAGVLLSATIFAGTTGKIVGSVKDGQTGQALVGANVLLVGTSLGASANLDGEYYVINVPPGIYTLKATMMGYGDVLVENVRISIDLTTTVNLTLNPTVLDAGESVTVIADRPMIQMDMTSSMATVDAQEIEAMPAQSINGVLELQAGIVDAGGLHIRGGRSGEVAYWVDGVATTDAFGYSSTAAIENSAVQELQVISGTFNAEYGQAMSGIINIITKDGGSDYHGSIRGYYGDYVSADDQYSVMKSVTTTIDPVTNKTLVHTESEDPLKKINPSQNMEFSLSGPMPFLKDKVTFFTNARFFSNEGYLYGREWFLPSGFPGDSSLVPMNPHERWSALGKITYRPTGSIKLSYSLNASAWKNDRSFNRSYKYVPGGVSQSMGNTQTHLFSLNHVLSPSTFYELKINRMHTEYESYLHKDLKTPNWLVRVPADSVSPELIFDPDTDEGKSTLQYLQELGLQYAYIPDPEDPTGYVHLDSAWAPTSYSFFGSGNNLNQYFRNSSYWIGKFDLTSQINQTHQMKAGFELRLHELNLDSYRLLAKTAPGRDEELVPFEPIIPAASNLYRDKYKRNPREFSAYAQDKIELKDLIINVGVRFDYFDANSVVPANPRDPNIYAPFLDENIYTDPTAAEDNLVEYTPEQRRDFMHRKVDAKTNISPRLGIAYPITDKGVIHFSYGHFFQIPEFRFLYDSPDFKLNSGGGQTIIGNADLEPQVTVQYEIGLQQQIGSNFGLDVSVFYRDIRDWVGTSPLIQTARKVVSYSIYENRDYANVRGLTLKAEQRMTDHFFAKLDYMYQVAEGTYSNPDDAFNAQLAENEPRRNLIPLNWDQRHTLSAQVMGKWKSWTASLVGKYRTGLPYSPSFARAEVVGGSALSVLPENSARRPIIQSVDLYLTKNFDVAGLDFTFFVYAYNVFDNRAATAVFADTGSPTYTTYPVPSEVAYSSVRVSTVQDLYNRPDWYIAPRQVQAGLTLGF